MALINSATSSIRVGASPIDKLYIGNTLSWTAPAPSTSILWTDNFDRVAANLAAYGNGWSATSTAESGNMNGADLTRTNNGSYARMMTTTSVSGGLPNNVGVEVIAPKATWGAFSGIAARFSTTNTKGIKLWMPDATTLQIGDAEAYNFSNMTLTTVQGIPTHFAATSDHTLRLEVRGLRADVFADGNNVGYYTVGAGTWGNDGISNQMVGIVGDALGGRVYRSFRVYSLTGTTPPASAYVIGTSYVNQATAATSMTMTLPSGLATGDRIYIAAMTSDSSAGATVTPSTTGWTVATPIADVGTMQRALYTAVYSGGLAAPSWALSASRKSGYVCVAVRSPSSSPIVSLADGGGLTQTAPSNTAAPSGVGLRLFVRKDNLSASVTPGPGMTTLTGALGVATGPSCHVFGYLTTQPVQESSGTAVTTWPVTSINSTAWTISL